MGALLLVRPRDDGAIDLPQDVREQLGVREGDTLAAVPPASRLLLQRRDVFAMEALDTIGEDLRAQGVTLDEWIESGRKIRAGLIRERYGIDVDRR